MAEKKEKRYVSDNAQLMAEWDFEKNNEISPSNITIGSGIKIWWKCNKGHSWNATIKDRARGRGCPFCAGQKIITGVNDLATTHPSIAKQWHPQKNTNSPANVFPQSNKSVWWICEKGHEYTASPAHRTTRNSGCPICSGKTILVGFNDLATTNPALAREWDYKKNKDLFPTQISRGSEKKVWWSCSRGHSWRAAIYSRVSGVGCPYCAKELQSSFPEKAIYFYIKKSFHDAIANYRHEKMNSLELDMFIPSLQLGIEYDGERWHQKIEKDLCKNRLCTEVGITLIRIREPACPILLDELSICIKRESKKIGLDKTIKCLLTKICEIANIDCAIDIDLKRDSIAILNLLNPLEKENNIAIIKPNLVSEWDYQKNGTLLPNMVTIGSDKKVWWICPKGHSYFSSVSSRVGGRGCPVCSGKTISKGYNDFASKCPNLLAEWDYEKNTISPELIAYGSDKKFWWKCNLGHSYEQSINNRRAGQSCPICSNKKVLVGFNDVGTTHPLIAKEWDLEYNSIKPSDVTAGSHKKIQWKCRTCGNKWEAPIYNRTSGHGCPYCSGRKATKRINDLETANPHLAREWNYEKNNGLLPSEFTANSGKTVWWKCQEGHEWQAKISNRNNGRGCPFCAGKKVLAGYNDLQTQNPMLAKEWNYEKNNGLVPCEVSPKSGKTVWWKCNKGHEWQARIDSRSTGNGCPQCAKEKRKRKDT